MVLKAYNGDGGMYRIKGVGFRPSTHCGVRLDKHLTGGLICGATCWPLLEDFQLSSQIR